MNFFFLFFSCRHTMFPGVGPSLTPDQIKYDINVFTSLHSSLLLFSSSSPSSSDFLLCSFLYIILVFNYSIRSSLILEIIMYVARTTPKTNVSSTPATRYLPYLPFFSSSLLSLLSPSFPSSPFLSLCFTKFDI